MRRRGLLAVVVDVLAVDINCVGDEGSPPLALSVALLELVQLKLRLKLVQETHFFFLFHANRLFRRSSSALRCGFEIKLSVDRVARDRIQLCRGEDKAFVFAVAVLFAG